ncbi:MAG: DUF2867 domain-containing protein, partial [Planctomycetota bacterium]
MPAGARRRIAVTGVTGYVGGRLAPLLLKKGYAVRCIVRTPKKLEERSWRSDPHVEVIQDDLSDPVRLAEHLRGCSAAYYLVHSMIAAGSGYAAKDRCLAANFARAADEAGVDQIIYLGGLGESSDALSEHLESRRETEKILRSGGVPVTVLRAAMIIGSGSASFEILQYLVNRLPVMVTPRWVRTESQPVAIRDVLHWLATCLETPATKGQTLELGGPDVLTYEELMQVAAEELGLARRLILTVPVLTPKLSSAWISLVTPVPYAIARPLAAGLMNRVVVEGRAAQELMPHEPLPVRDAIARALAATVEGRIETRWSVAGAIPGDPDWAGGKVFTDERSIDVQADRESVFAAVCRIGGGHGWYAGDLLWKIRGWMDQMVGGPGLRRGRRHPEQIEYGEALDFWRVVGLDRGERLVLLAEMKLPGDAELGFNIQPADAVESSRLTMKARYRPRGLFGIAYWYTVAPLHDLVFGGMLKGIRDTAEAIQETKQETTRMADESNPQPVGYGRARLWLGISAVGSVVVLATTALILGTPEWFQRTFGDSVGSQLLALMAFFGAYALIQLPFDLFGGFLLPKWHGRSHPPLPTYLTRLARGVAAHTVMLLVCAIALTIGAWAFGALGMVAAAAFVLGGLLLTRAGLASLYAPLSLTPSEPIELANEDPLGVLLAATDDEGFTGGVLGVGQPTRHVLPLAWRRVLGPEDLKTALRRRSLAITTGA